MKLEAITPMLQAADLRQTIDFYTALLGFRLVNAWPEESPCWCCLERDGLELMFTHDPNVERDSLKLSGVLYFRIQGVLALQERLAGKVSILWGPEVFHYGMREFAIRDCNGYTLSFGEPTDDPPTCPED